MSDDRHVPDRHVVVIGGGIAGLAAVHALTHAAAAPRVTLLESSDRLGGKLHSSAFAGHAAIDEGPDAFLARIPFATELATAVGLGEQLTHPTSGSAYVYWNGLHDIPAGLTLGMPTGLGSMVRSRLISWPGKLRAALEPLLPRTSLDSDSVGDYVRARFGREVHYRLVDPLVGSIYAADTDYFSLAAVPQLAALANGGRSVMLSRRPAAPASAGPIFNAPRRGMSSLIEALADDARSRGALLQTGVAVTELAADGGRWKVDGQSADAVVLACPAPAAAGLLGAVIDSDPLDGLSQIRTADVAIVTVAIPAADWPARLHGRSGYLVPKPMQRLVTATSFGSQKWAHWDDGAQVILRISLGRDGLPVLHLSDDQLIDAAVLEVGRHLKLDVQPTAVRLSRWPGAFPQYRPHHGQRVQAIASAMSPTLALAGASYHGIGIPACVHSAQRAAAQVLAALR